MKAEGAAQINFFGHDLVHGQSDFTAQTHCDQHAARRNDIHRSAQCGLAAGGLKHRVKLALVSLVFVERIGLRAQVDGFVGAHLARALQRQISDVGGDDARRAGAP